MPVWVLMCKDLLVLWLLIRRFLAQQQSSPMSLFVPLFLLKLGHFVSGILKEYNLLGVFRLEIGKSRGRSLV